MADLYVNHGGGLDSPGYNAEDIAPNDSADLATSTRSIYVGAAGDLKVTMVGGNTVVFKNVPVGFAPIRAKRVWSAGTTATLLRAVW